MMEVILDPKFAKKSRTDNWWIQPLVITAVLAAFVLYTTYAILIGDNFKFSGNGAHYVSPIYSPELEIDWWHFSPAFILIWIPLGFRATCYYCRRLYYRSFFLDPLACAINDKKPLQLNYKGEERIPFLLNNLHRYFLYGAILLMIWHWVDVVLAMQFGNGWGIGVGTILIGADALFLTLYVVSCHSFRHMIGGKLNWFSRGFFNQRRFAGWHFVSKLNEHHNAYFWLSALSVMAADIYIRLLAMGILPATIDFAVKFI